MEMPADNLGPIPEEGKIVPAEKTTPPEEPILLNELFSKAGCDLDALFPDPQIKKLLKDVVKNRQKNERFLKTIRTETASLVEEDESAESAWDFLGNNFPQRRRKGPPKDSAFEGVF